VSKVKWSCYRPGVAQRVGRGIALLFHDRGTRRGWVVSGTPQPHFTPGKDPVPILWEAGWVENLVPTGIRSRIVQPVVSRHTNWATGPAIVMSTGSRCAHFMADCSRLTCLNLSQLSPQFTPVNFTPSLQQKGLLLWYIISVKRFWSTDILCHVSCPWTGNYASITHLIECIKLLLHVEFIPFAAETN